MGKPVNGHQIIELFEQFSPKSLAMEGDPIGLQIGRLNQPIDRVIVALDVLEEVVDEAIRENAKLIIAHHPIIYRPLKSLQTDKPSGRIIAKLIQHDIAVYVAHTNLDVAKGGVNDWLAEKLELSDTNVLVPTTEDRLKKVVVFVPKDHADSVRNAMTEAGAGNIGEYAHCTFTSEGTGRFMPTEEANPFIGKSNRLEEVEEVRIETIVHESLLKKVITMMIKAHPYEEAAYDIYDESITGEKLGLGRIGKLKSAMTLDEFADYVKSKLDVPSLRFVGQPSAQIKKVAVLGGTGNKYMTTAKFSGADVYVTGDVDYHIAHDALMMGLNIVDPGHNVEKVMKQGVAEVMEKRCKAKGYEVKFIASSLNTDPFTFK